MKGFPAQEVILDYVDGELKASCLEGKIHGETAEPATELLVGTHSESLTSEILYAKEKQKMPKCP